MEACYHVAIIFLLETASGNFHNGIREKNESYNWTCLKVEGEKSPLASSTVAYGASCSEKQTKMSYSHLLNVFMQDDTASLSQLTIV